jgi:hypothetical protein
MRTLTGGKDIAKANVEPLWSLHRAIKQYKSRPYLIMGMAAALLASVYLIVFAGSLGWWSVNLAQYLLMHRVVLEYFWFLGVFGLTYAVIAGCYMVVSGGKNVRNGGQHEQS